ncbi:MAG: alkylated DNA repair dioxygenase AlkB [Oceanicoccus sp.]|jgi:alkylated DNA repair dioxygenase AlkB
MFSCRSPAFSVREKFYFWDLLIYGGITAPLRQFMTPMGHLTKVKMSNCGKYGWISDQNGYRYSSTDPQNLKD